MQNVIPRFIQKRIEEDPDVTSGSLSGSCLFVDIAGFTRITGELMDQGRQGAEELSVLINRVYGPLIERVYAADGFIAVFAGDSITAVFPGGAGTRVLSAAESINDHFLGRSDGIRVRAGLAAGRIEWSIFGGKRKAYLFHGSPVLNSSLVVKGSLPGTLTLHRSFEGFSGGPGTALTLPKRIKPTIAGKFVPPQVIAAGGSGEFRNVASVFMNFAEDQPGSTVERVLELTGKTGGFWNGMFHDDKGTHALVVFGAPVSRENDFERASVFAAGLVEEFGDRIRAGVSGGIVYAGTVGTSRRCTYTVLGDRVNKAARLMERAAWGQFLATGEIQDEIRSFDPFASAMVGRKKELAELVEWCSPLLGGGFCGVFHVGGMAGMGKSLLLYRLGRELKDRAQTLVMQTDQILRKSLNPFEYLVSHYFQTGNSQEEDGKKAFDQRWVELLQRLKTAQADFPEEDLRRARPFLESLAGLAPEDPVYTSMDARGRFENTIFAVKEFVRALSRLSPIVLVVEDIHWLDSDSRTLIRNLTRGMEGYPVAIMATARPADDGSLPILGMEEGTRTGSLLLTPLPDREEASLIQELLTAEPARELTAFIQKRTEGNPFFAEQFCRYLEENGLLATVNGQARLKDSDFQIPRGINAVIVARIDRLSAKLRDMVQTASVLGREFDVKVLSRLLARRSSPFDSLLGEGESEAIWNAVSEVRYIFRHAILRDTVYAMQMKRKLRRLHGMTAEAIGAVYGDDGSRYAERAYHYEMARNDGLAAEYLKKAADFARDRYRNDEALDLYQRLLPFCKTLESQLEAELQRADLMIEKGDRDTARGMILDCLARAEKAGDRYFAARCNKNLAKLYHRQGKNDEAAAHLETASGIFREMDDTWETASSLNILGNINTVLGNYDAALENFSQSTAEAEKASDRITVTLNLSNVGNIHLYRYELDKAEEYYLKAMEMCREINERKGLANAYNNMAVIWYYRKDLDRCRSYLDRFIEIATEIGNREGLTYIYGNLGILHQELKEFDTAIEYHRKQAELAEELGDLYNTAKAMHQTGHIHWLQGRFQPAVEYMLRGIEFCERTGDQRSNSQSNRDLGIVYEDMGEYGLARKHLLRACELGEKGRDLEACGTSCSHLADVALKLGEPWQAWDYAEKAIDSMRKIDSVPSLLVTLLEVAEFLHENGRRERAAELLTEAETLMGEENTESHRDRYLFTRSLVLSGTDPESALKDLRSLAENCGEDRELLARVHQVIHSLTGSDEHRRKSRALFQKLYDSVPKASWKERLDSLS